MKLNIGNKILMVLHWLCSLMICVAFALCLAVPDLQAKLISKAEGTFGTLGAKIAGGVLLALYLALSVATLMVLLRRKRRAERGFITVGPDENNKVRIAVSAVEQMVRQSVQNIDGISDMKVDIDGVDDAIAIAITATITNGVHVPTVTANMQRSITQFVEVSCGVAVHSVAITINAISGRAEPARRGLWGKNKPQAGTAVPAYEARSDAPDAVDGVAVANDGIPGAQVGAAAREDAPAPVEEAPQNQASAYDPDKPYESEFAKDLAAMKAREAAGNAEPSDSDAARE